MNQYNNIRKSHTCPNCGEDKKEGLILCWPCHHSQKFHNDGGYSKRLTAKLESLDKFLAQSNV